MNIENIILNVLIIVIIIVIVNHFIRRIRKRGGCRKCHLNLASEIDRIEYFNTNNDVKIENNYGKEPVYDNAGYINKTPDVDNPIGNQGEINQYIKDFFLQDQYLREPKIVIDEDKTKKYRDNFFTFRDKIMQESQQFTVADKALQMKIDEVNFGGRKIADVYDGLVDTNNLYDKQFLRMPKQDTSAIQNTFYVKEGANGKYTSDDLWIYDKDRIMNGGNFYKDVYPYDDINGKKYLNE